MRPCLRWDTPILFVVVLRVEQELDSFGDSQTNLCPKQRGTSFDRPADQDFLVKLKKADSTWLAR